MERAFRNEGIVYVQACYLPLLVNFFTARINWWTSGRYRVLVFMASLNFQNLFCILLLYIIHKVIVKFLEGSYQMYGLSLYVNALLKGCIICYKNTFKEFSGSNSTLSWFTPRHPSPQQPPQFTLQQS